MLSDGIVSALLLATWNSIKQSLHFKAHLTHANLSGTCPAAHASAAAMTSCCSAVNSLTSFLQSTIGVFEWHLKQKVMS